VRDLWPSPIVSHLVIIIIISLSVDWTFGQPGKTFGSVLLKIFSFWQFVDSSR